MRRRTEWKPGSEQELGQVVVKLLQKEGWTLYYEVQLQELGNRADIVAVRSSTTVIIELKRSLSLDVLAQAIYWSRRKLSNQVWIIIPYLLLSTRRGKGRRLAEALCREWKVGLFEVRGFDQYFQEAVSPENISDTNPAPIREVLQDEHKTWADPGTNRGGHVTKFAMTRERVIAYVQANPGCTVAELVKAVKHHYSSDRGAGANLLKLTRNGLIKGLRCERSNDSSHKPVTRFYFEGSL